jgi:NitT/TauT family transport system substrate-binding protein
VCCADSPEQSSSKETEKISVADTAIGEEMKRTKRIIAELLLIVTLLLACGQSQPPKTPDQVRVQLKWIHQAQFAGFYMAQEKGFYTKENLKVSFLEGGQGIDNTQAVLSGEADFGVITSEDILIERSLGRPLTAIAAIYRRSGTVFAAKADSGIVKPADILGKTVALSAEPGVLRYFEVPFYAMMKKLGLDVSSVRFVPYEPTYRAFLEGKAEVTPCFATGGLIRLRDQGVKLNLIWPSDYGIRFYADTLATTDMIVGEKSDLVTRFLRATLKGWQDAVGNPEEALTATLKYAGASSRELQSKMMDAQMPLIHTGEDRIGWMKPEEWNDMYRMLLDQNLLATPVDVERAYTMEFLKKVYKGQRP